MKLIGIDGCRGGWVSASANLNLARITFAIHADLTSIFSDALRDGNIVVIDIPIGLPLSGPRACDVAARKYLGPGRRSSVFPAPCQATTAATAYEEVKEINFRASGKMVSMQTFHILPKIREVDRLITAPLQNWIREAHPEVTFAALNQNGSGPLVKKSKPQGRGKRLALISQVIREIDDERMIEERRALGAAMVDIDDLVDGLACLITASRVMKETAFSLPLGQVEVNGRGLRMEIVA